MQSKIFNQKYYPPAHIPPEAYLGGPLALVEEGDTIHIDIPGGILSLMVETEEIERRQKHWKMPPDLKLEKGAFLERYRRMVGAATRGAVFE